MVYKTYVDYLLIISRVFRDKCYYSLFHSFDLFEKVDRIYPDEKYYSWGDLLEDASPVIDNIYLGSAFNGADYSWLKETDIEIVVNATESISNFFPDEFTYHNFPAEDLGTGSLKLFYEDFCNVVDNNPDKKILVHCYAGRSRSASLVLYYLITRLDMTLEKALEFLKNKRSIININQEFVQEIWLETK